MSSHLIIFPLSRSAAGAIWPFVQVYARQLGFSAVAVGWICTTAAALAMFMRPLAGVLSDVWRCKRPMMLGLLALFALTCSGLWYLGASRSDASVAEPSEPYFWLFAGCWVLAFSAFSCQMCLSNTVCVQLLGRLHVF